MARVHNEFQQYCYVPGIVQSINAVAKPKEFLVMYFNGNTGQHVRNQLVLINKNRYGITSNYIKNKLGMK